MSLRPRQVNVKFLFFCFLIMLDGEERNNVQIVRLYISDTFLNVTGPIGYGSRWDVTNLEHPCSLSDTWHRLCMLQSLQL